MDEDRITKDAVDIIELERVSTTNHDENSRVYCFILVTNDAFDARMAATIEFQFVS